MFLTENGSTRSPSTDNGNQNWKTIESPYAKSKYYNGLRDDGMCEQLVHTSRCRCQPVIKRPATVGQKRWGSGEFGEEKRVSLNCHPAMNMGAGIPYLSTTTT